MQLRGARQHVSGADTSELTSRGSARHHWTSLAVVIMLGTLFGLIALVFGLVLRYEPEARGPRTRKR
jgi:H+/Cl- antiporter ClcA